MTISDAIRHTHEQSNLHRLLELSLDEGQPRIETVEILRELGRFDEARLALMQVDPNTPGINIIAAKIGEEDCRVCRTQEPAWNNETVSH